MKFSIVTPSYNLARWLPDTVESVLSQEGDFEIEYIVIDGQSTDETPAILAQYKEQLDTGTYPIRCKKVSFTYYVLPPSGMYAAINTGFSHATGNIYAWINADDVYKPGAFAAIQKALSAFPEVNWVKGTSDHIDITGAVTRPGISRIYRQDWLALGVYGMQAYFVEQDSVFWRAALWKEVGGIPENLRYAGDYWLWMQFAKHHKLWTLNVPVSSYRKREGQLGMQVDKYKGEQRMIQGRPSPVLQYIRIFFSLRSRGLGFLMGLYPFLFGFRREAYIDLSPYPLYRESGTFIL